MKTDRAGFFGKTPVFVFFVFSCQKWGFSAITRPKLVKFCSNFYQILFVLFLGHCEILTHFGQILHPGGSKKWSKVVKKRFFALQSCFNVVQMTYEWQMHRVLTFSLPNWVDLSTYTYLPYQSCIIKLFSGYKESSLSEWEVKMVSTLSILPSGGQKLDFN